MNDNINRHLGKASKHGKRVKSKRGKSGKKKKNLFSSRSGHTPTPKPISSPTPPPTTSLAPTPFFTGAVAAETPEPSPIPVTPWPTNPPLPGPPEDNWLSNLPEKGVCGTQAGSDTSFGCGQYFTDEGIVADPFGYYLTCFDNLQEFKSLTSIRFWTDSVYGVGDGIGATISFYYAYRPSDGAPLEPFYIFTNPNGIPYYPPPQDRYAFAIREVPSAEETGGTTYKSGLNSFTFDDPVDISPNSNPIDAFCVGLTPPLRSTALCGRFGYCSDSDLSVQTYGPSENSNLKCSTRFAPDGTNTGNPDFNFFPNEDAGIPGFCIEVEGSTKKSLTCPSPAPTNIPLQKVGSYPSPTLTTTIDSVTTANDCFYMHWDEESPR